MCKATSESGPLFLRNLINSDIWQLPASGKSPYYLTQLIFKIMGSVIVLMSLCHTGEGEEVHNLSGDRWRYYTFHL